MKRSLASVTITLATNIIMLYIGIFSIIAGALEVEMTYSILSTLFGWFCLAGAILGIIGAIFGFKSAKKSLNYIILSLLLITPICLFNLVKSVINIADASVASIVSGQISLIIIALLPIAAMVIAMCLAKKVINENNQN